MRKTMYGYRGLDAANNTYFVMPVDLGYEISKTVHKQAQQRGEIYFINYSSECLIKINGTEYKGSYSLDNKLLKLEIPGFINHRANLKEFKFKSR